MEIRLDNITDQQLVPERYAFGAMDKENHVALSANRNPGVTWNDVPEGTRSLVLICVDTDVPTRPDDVNQDGRTVPADLPRTNFYHWVMVDIPLRCDAIEEGSCANGVIAGGKSNPEGPAGTRQGLNDYTGWFANDKEMGGDYYGYDGPCPPWNDSIVHHYHFVLYATDLERCPVDGRFGGKEVEAALVGHVLTEARCTGKYTLNPNL